MCLLHDWHLSLNWQIFTAEFMADQLLLAFLRHGCFTYNIFTPFSTHNQLLLTNLYEFTAEKNAPTAFLHFSLLEIREITHIARAPFWWGITTLICVAHYVEWVMDLTGKRRQTWKEGAMKKENYVLSN